MFEFDLVWSAAGIDDVVMDFSFRTEDFVGNDIDEISSSIILQGNYPNPFNPETCIEYILTEAGEVNLSIYDIKGRLINTLVNGYEAAGEHSIVWVGDDFRGSSAVSGVYFYKINNGKFTTSKKMILMK